MKTKGVPSTPFLLMLLSVVAVVTCTQPEAMVPNPGGAVIPQQDTPTSVDSNHTEERDPISSLKTLLPRLSAKIMSKVQDVKNAPLTRGIKLRLSYRTTKAVKRLFEKYKVGSVEKDLFGSFQYQEWSTIILKAFPEDKSRAHRYIAKQLVTYHGGKLLPMLQDAKQDITWRVIGEQIERALVGYWVDKSNGDVAALVRNPLLQQWYKGAKENMEDPAAELSYWLYLYDTEVKGVDLHLDEKTALEIVSELRDIERYRLKYKVLYLDRKVSINALLTSERFKEWVKIVKADSEADLGKVVLATLRKRCESDSELINELFVPDMTTEDVRGAVVKALINEWTQSYNDLTYGLQKLGNKSPYVEALRSPKLQLFNDCLSELKLTDKDSIAQAALLYEDGVKKVKLQVDTWLKKLNNAKKDAESSAEPVLDPLIQLNDEDKPAIMLRSAGEKKTSRSRN